MTNVTPTTTIIDVDTTPQGFRYFGCCVCTYWVACIIPIVISLGGGEADPAMRHTIRTTLVAAMFGGEGA